MKTILLEGSILSKQVANGISNYLCQLFSSDSESDFDKKVLVWKDYANNLFVNESNLSSEKFIPVSKTRFYSALATGQLPVPADLFHSPYMFLPPKSTRHINLLTVHDVINLGYSNFTLKGKLREMFLRAAIGRADHYICISKTTRENLVQHYPSLNESKLHVIYQGIDELFLSPEKVSGQTPIGQPYLLYVGQRNGYKNFMSLLQYFKRSSWKDQLRILCVGGGKFSKEESRFINKSGLSGMVQHAGYINNLELKYLYQNAFALAYTSLQEGFGLPILEAMACGCAVLCGNFSSMKEISNGHSILMEDFTFDSFDAALKKASEFAESERIKAQLHARSFSWKQTAQSTSALYAKLIDGAATIS